MHREFENVLPQYQNTSSVCHSVPFTWLIEEMEGEVISNIGSIDANARSGNKRKALLDPSSGIQDTLLGVLDFSPLCDKTAAT